jgi:hypothetical protein
MNQSKHNDKMDPLDAELGRQIVRTSPELEARFRGLRSELEENRRGEPGGIRIWNTIWLQPAAWAGAAVAASLAFVAWLWFGTAPTPVIDGPADFAAESLFLEDPFTWNASLADALVLLDEEALETLLLITHETKS